MPPMDSSCSSGWKYDVFLSFRGEDTRNGFTAHLYEALKNRGINTFMDDPELGKGQVISPALFRAIQNSRSSIIVLSRNYASSSWCLEELVKILQSKTSTNGRVLPVFYDVDPSDVRKQKGEFGRSFRRLVQNLKGEKMKRVKVWKLTKILKDRMENRVKILGLNKNVKGWKMKRARAKIWRKALIQVANIAGWNSRNRSEAKLIEDIIADIGKDLYYVTPKVTYGLVGVDSCIRKLKSLLCLTSKDVRMVGIWGMGGIGKTALAKALYGQISNDFDGCCFLDNAQNLASKGDNYLRKELVSSLLIGKNIEVTITSVKARFHSKKVLIVFDNVNNRSTLKTLLGELDWLGPQSRIIITTRDKQVLTMHGVSLIYEVHKLPNEKAIELFNRHAFLNQLPGEDMMELSERVIAYAQGLPLALEVLGSSLCGKTKDEWECALKKLEKIPKMEIHQVLQTSFDELDHDEKNIFLDIAIVFNGFDRDSVTEMLESFGFSAISGISTLIDKSLISSTSDDELQVHDLLAEMAKEIIRQTSPTKLGNRSRLWEQRDICHVLQNMKGTDKVEWITLRLSGLKEICFTTDAFAKMSRLRLLVIGESWFSQATEDHDRQIKCKVEISDDFKFQNDGLKFLVWEGFPWQSFPFDFLYENLAFLALVKSQLTKLWEGKKDFKSLKYMAVDNSEHLKETPDFSGVTNLKALNFEGCTQLCEIHRSIGALDKLTQLNFENCTNLEQFPGLSHLVSLESLVLSGCSKLEKFPHISRHMPCLKELYLDGTAIIELPSSIAYATGLVLLDLQNCWKLLRLSGSICDLKHLETLLLSGCSRLGEPQLDSDNLNALPRTMDRLPSMRKLDLRNCESLTALPPLSCSSVQLVNASDCRSLKYLSPQSVFIYFGGSIFGNCFQLSQYPSKMEPHFREMATHFDKDAWTSAFDQQYPNVQVPFSTIFPGSIIPNWFMHHGEGYVVEIDVDPDWCDSNFLGFALSTVIAPEEDGYITRGWSTYCKVDLHDLKSESKSSFVCSFMDDHPHKLKRTTINLDHLWLAYVPSLSSFNCKNWCRIKFSFSTSLESCIVKGCGVCPLYTDDSGTGDYSIGNRCSTEGLGGRTGSVLSDLREWGLEDTPVDVYEDMNATHGWNQEMLWTRNAQWSHERNPGKSLPRNQYESTVEDGEIRRRILYEEYPSTGVERVPMYTHTWDRDREKLRRHPHPITFNTGTWFWIFVSALGFFFLARVFHWASSFRFSLLGVLLMLLFFSWL